MGAVGEAILAAARRIHDRGLVVGTTGNVSARDGDLVRITPTRLAYATLRVEDLVAVAEDGSVVAGRHAPSRETPLHLAVYRARPDVAAIVHTHSVHATAWSFLGEPLRPETEETRYYAIGAVATAPAAEAGTAELAEAAARALRGSRAVLLGGHGVLAVGATPADAVTVAEAVEHQARIAWLLRGAPAAAAG